MSRASLEEAPVEWIFLAGDTPSAKLAAWLVEALPACAWVCHVVVVTDDPDGRLLDAVVDHLQREPLTVVHLHQVITDWRESSAFGTLITSSASSANPFGSVVTAIR